MLRIAFLLTLVALLVPIVGSAQVTEHLPANMKTSTFYNDSDHYMYVDTYVDALYHAGLVAPHHAFQVPMKMPAATFAIVYVYVKSHATYDAAATICHASLHVNYAGRFLIPVHNAPNLRATYHDGMCHIFA